MKIWNKLSFFKRGERESIYDRIIKSCLLLLVFLMPIFFLPTRPDLLEINKTLLLYLLVMIASLTWFIKMMVTKQVVFLRTKLDYLVLIFGLIYVLATIFSVNRLKSFLGESSYYNDSLVTVILLMMLYFVTANHFRKTYELSKFVFTFLAGSALSVIVGILEVVGIKVFPLAAATSNTFNLVANSSSVYAIFLASLLPLTLGTLTFVKQRIGRILLVVLAGLAFINLLLLDLNVGWLCLAFGFLLLLLILAWRSQELPTIWIILPTLIIVLAVALYVINIPGITKLEVQPDITLGYQNSLRISAAAIRSSFLLGSGPATFYYDFAQHRPTAFNNHPYWDLSFIKSNSQWLQWIATIGVVATLVWLVYSFYVLVRSFVELIKRPLNDEWKLQLTLYGGWLIFLIGGFFYSFSIFLIVLFVFFLALMSARLMPGRDVVLSLAKVRWARTVIPIGFAIWLVISVLILYFGGQFYAAQIYSQKAKDLVQQVAEINKVEDYLKKAVSLNKYAADYRFSLAESYVVDVQLKAQASTTPDTAAINTLLTQAAQEINQGVSLDPKNPQVYLAKANLYLNLLNYVQGSEQVAFKSYQDAITLSPGNPLLPAELGRIYYLLATQLNSVTANKNEQLIGDFLKSAITNLEQSIAVKDNFSASHYLLAQIYDLQRSKAGADEAKTLKEKTILELQKVLVIDPTNKTALQELQQLQQS